MSGKLAGKTAIVTGASKGIGASIAEHLGAEGARVVVNYSSSQSGADRVVAAIAAQGGEAIAVQANVATEDDIKRLFAESTAAFGPVDILVNNAGLYDAAPLGHITAAHFHKHFDLNVLGLILTTQESLRHFNSAGGVIINVSSVLSTISVPALGVYCATKAAVDSLTRTFAKELARKNIRVNAVNPARIATEGLHAAGIPAEDSGEPDPMGRIGRPEHIARAVVFMASEDGAWMNGETLVLTGGVA
jgi:3-oxoacyl-[acyl-carrier protein] reductase